MRAPVDGLEGRLGSSGGGHYYVGRGRGVGGYYVRREGGGTIRRGRGAVKWQLCVTRPARDELSPTKDFLPKPKQTFFEAPIPTFFWH